MRMSRRKRQAAHHALMVQERQEGLAAKRIIRKLTGFQVGDRIQAVVGGREHKVKVHALDPNGWPMCKIGGRYSPYLEHINPLSAKLIG